MFSFGIHCGYNLQDDPKNTFHSVSKSGVWPSMLLKGKCYETILYKFCNGEKVENVQCDMVKKNN